MLDGMTNNNLDYSWKRKRMSFHFLSMKKESSKESHQRKKPLDFRTKSPKILRMVSAVTAERLLLVTAKRSLPWNSSFLSHRQIKFTENTAFSRINACFSLCKPKKRLHPDRSGGSKGEKHWAVFLLLLKNAQVLPLAVLSFYRFREADSVIFISSKKENRAGVFSATKFLFAHEQRMPEKRSVVNWHLFNLWYNYRQNIFAVRENNAFRIKER